MRKNAPTLLIASKLLNFNLLALVCWQVVDDFARVVSVSQHCTGLPSERVIGIVLTVMNRKLSIQIYRGKHVRPSGNRGT